MSATTELLLEQIKKVEEALNAARAAGDPVSLAALQKRLKTLNEQLNASNSALNESKSVLKG